MDKDRVKGKAKDIAGRVERQVGEWTGDTDAQVKGATKQAEGKVQNVVGKMKDKVRDLRDKAEESRDEDRNRNMNDDITADDNPRKRETEAPLGRRDKRAA